MEREPWARLETERAEDFQMFVEYRDAPASQRWGIIASIAEKYGKNTKTVLNLSYRNKWKSRAEKFDDYKDAELRKVGLRKAEKIREEALTTAEQMLELAKKKLQVMSEASLTPRDTREFIKAAVALAEVYKDDQSKQRDYLSSDDGGADVVIYLPEIEQEREVTTDGDDA